MRTPSFDLCASLQGANVEQICDTTGATTKAAYVNGIMVTVEADVESAVWELEMYPVLMGFVLLLGVASLSLVEMHKKLAKLETANRALKDLTCLDPLTGLTNRRAFEEALKREQARMIRNSSTMALVYIDADDFKLLNDSEGHQHGDDCLIAISKELRCVACRPADVVARIGGEEFVLLLPDTDLTGAVQVAEAARSAVEGLCLPNPNSGTAPYLTISIGVAAASGNPADLVAEADQALYAAKRAGRNRIFVSRSVSSEPLRAESA